MVVGVNLFSFSTGTYESLYSRASLPSLSLFLVRYLLPLNIDFVNSSARLYCLNNCSNPKYLMFFSMVQIKKPPAALMVL
jgi:hypothetical protein